MDKTQNPEQSYLELCRVHWEADSFISIQGAEEARYVERTWTMIDTWTEVESCRAGQRLHHHSIRITELSQFPAVSITGHLRYQRVSCWCQDDPGTGVSSDPLTGAEWSEFVTCDMGDM